MSLLKIYVSLILMLNGVVIVRSQPTNPVRGDGFWTQISTMRMEQIIWHNDTLYAARNPFFATQINGGVYRSIDGGVSWDTLYSVAYNASAGVRLFLHPTDSRILFIINGSLFKSTNSGQSWTWILTGNGPLVRLAINPQNPLIMYATKTYPFGTVYKTTNGGNNWSIAGDGLMQDIYFATGPININPEYPDTILLGTNAGLYRSNNGGTLWSLIKNDVIWSITRHNYTPSVVFLGTSEGTLKSTDEGVTWILKSNSFVVDNLCFYSLDENIIYSNDNFKSTDLGETWYLLDSLNSFGFSDITINLDSLPTLYSSSANGIFSFRDLITGIDELNNLSSLDKISLVIYPNPFNSTTTIQLTIPEQKEISIQIYDILGRLIKTVLNNSFIEPGQHRYYWDGKNDAGSTVSTGIYLCKIFINQNNSNEVKSLKLILLK